MNYIHSSWLARKKVIRRQRIIGRCIIVTLLILIGIPAGAAFIPSRSIYVKNVIAEVEEIKESAEPLTTIEEKAQSLKVKSETIREVTMYSSTPYQTDTSPCIGSSGEDQCDLWKRGENICATNAFPNDTILKVDKLGHCVVKDAMNKRYANRIDWYAGYDEECLDGVDEGDNCPIYKRALSFGTQKLSVAVYSN